MRVEYENYTEKDPGLYSIEKLKIPITDKFISIESTSYFF